MGLMYADRVGASILIDLDVIDDSVNDHVFHYDPSYGRCRFYILKCYDAARETVLKSYREDLRCKDLNRQYGQFCN